MKDSSCGFEREPFFSERFQGFKFYIIKKAAEKKKENHKVLSHCCRHI